MGLTSETVIGAPLQMWNGSGKIVGVTDDFANGNLRQATQPLIMMYTTTNGAGYHIKTIAAVNRDQKLARIEAIAKKYAPDTPFEYSFLDEDIKRQYDEDVRVSKMITSFTVIAMIISCLGLYGLSTYMAERRFKEIGVRKVMGASVKEIMAMMSSEFIRLVLVAFIIAVPVSLYVINQWLENFAYKTPVSISIFILAGVSALLIAVITVSFQSFKAASVNPVKSLRTE